MATEITRYDKDTAFRAECAVAVSAGELVGLDSNGKLVLADADAATPVLAVGFALTDGAIGDTIGVATQGELVDSSWSWTPPARLFTSDTAGAITATAPATATDVIQMIGWARSATKVIINVTPVVLELQAAGTTTVAFH